MNERHDGGPASDVDCSCAGGTHETACCLCDSTGHCCVEHENDRLKWNRALDIIRTDTQEGGG